MARIFKSQEQLSAYRDRRFQGTQEEFDNALRTSSTVYVGNMSFYTTEEQVYEVFSRCGEIKKMIMGLDKNSKTPCGFCFVTYYTREDTEDCVKYVSGTILDDRPIRVDFDWGFEEGRQFGRGRSGGQVRDEYRTDYDPDRGGYGKLVQKELEAQRQLVDYGGPMGPLHIAMPMMPPFPVFPPQAMHGRGHHGNWAPRRRDRPHGDRPDRSHYDNRDGGRRDDGGSRKRQRDGDGPPPPRQEEQKRRVEGDSKPEKNPRFRERGEEDDEDEDGGKS